MSITHSSIVESPIDEVFAWHARPGAFARLAPPWQPAKVLLETTSLRDGEAVLGLPGGLTWVSRHDPDGYDPPRRFVDTIGVDGLASLPVRAALKWRHSHEFAAESETTTRVTDRVDTPVGSRALRPMFVYRHRQLADDLAAHRWAASLGVQALTIAMTGSSGLVGSALSAFLTTGGHRVIRLVRGVAGGADERHWDPMHPDAGLLDGVDALIHLAGESIAGRFTESHKKAIRQSRIAPTARLAELAAAASDGPKVLVVASAIGYYGADRGDEVLSEDSGQGAGFLADVVAEWEAATRPAMEAGIRVSSIRTGIVQAARGGTLRLFRPLFAAGLGGPISDGRQWLSWIDLEDLVDVYHRALVDTGMSGPINAVAPAAVRNAEYTRTLGRVMRRPALLPVPTFGPRILLGEEGSTELAEADQRVVPTKLEGAGHHFRQPTLEGSLRHQLGRIIR
ncbi:TIGR01777 family oxidoreductase [Parafrigoribacterium soli]|uniref:TIGR01777 family oxidoreductase n=1 Tax=Parafrigoribacterium soli TaxID=3144663 RepID=UPI0032EABEB6